MHILIILFLTILIYSNSFSGVFVFDDDPNILGNHNIHINEISFDSLKNTFYGVHGDKISRPLSYLSFGLNYYFHSDSVYGYHLINLIIHCIAALFLYIFIFRTLHLPLLVQKYGPEAASIALLATVLWAVSPIQVTAVTYIVQRMASMAGMFFIMAMFFYLLGRTSEGMGRKVGYFALCVVSGLLAVASKENAAILPVAIFLYDLILIQGVNRESLKRNLLWAGVPLCILVILAFVLTNPLNMLSGYANREFTLMERLLTQPRILVYYVSLMLYPIMDRLTLIHEIELSRSIFTPWTTLPAILFWASVLLLGLLISKSHPLVSFCLLFFIVTHVIESSVIPLELIFEHRNYIPSISLFIILSVMLIKLLIFCIENGYRFSILLLSFLLVFSIYDQGHTVLKRNELFHHPFYLWKDSVNKSPGLSRVHINIGLVYWNLQKYNEAKKSFEKAIEVDRYHRSALRATPFENLGSYYLYVAMDPVSAIELFEKARAIRPKYWPLWYRQALALVHLDKLDYASIFLDQATKIIPYNAQFHELFSIVHLHNGNMQRATIHALQAKILNNQSKNVNKILGEAQRQLGNLEQAKRYWRTYTSTSPNDIQATLALLELAWLTDDNPLLKQTAVQLLSMKGGRTWEELFDTLPKYKSERVWMRDPFELLPVIAQGVLMELGVDLMQSDTGQGASFEDS